MLELWDLFQKGGLVMYPLVFCSFCAVAIFIERMLLYKEAMQIDQRELVAYYNGLEGELKRKRRL